MAALSLLAPRCVPVLWSGHTTNPAWPTNLEAKLGQLSPLAILNRGYAIVTGEDGHVLMDAAAAPEGSSIDVRLARGRLAAEVRKSLLAANKRE